MANIHYIKAAIEASLGIKISLKDTARILVEEKMLTEKQARASLFRGYNEFYPYFYSQDKNVIETTPQEYKIVDVVEALNEA